jgi:DNA (cytosine-5)-methyltransferase 1
MRKLRVLDLFSGIGGFSLGLERTGGFETAAFCEIEPFPRRVLAKHWPGVPIHMDVRKLRGEDVGPVDVICGGYPCQPFSTAGKRAGKDDDRHLWPEFSRLVDELRPAWVIGENVAGHISMGLDDVLADLEGKGYACRAFVVPACGVGAPHKRERVWTVAHAPLMQRNGSNHYAGRDIGSPRADEEIPESRNSRGGADMADAPRQFCHGRENGEPLGAAIQGKAGTGGGPGHVADAGGGRLSGSGEPFIASNPTQGGEREATQPFHGGFTRERGAESAVGGGPHGFPGWLDGSWERGIARVASGVPERAARLKALGNAVVPQIPEMIGRAILAAEASP